MAVLALHSRNAPLALEDCFDFFHRGLHNGLLDGLDNMLLHRQAAMCERTRAEPSTAGGVFRRDPGFRTAFSGSLDLCHRPSTRIGINFTISRMSRKC